MLRFLTAGESHGKCLIAILEGLPAGLKLNAAKIDAELKRRQSGYGRGPRMKIEKDKVQILSGLRKGLTLGSPIALKIDNKDFSIEKLPNETAPRPGHADLAGAIKYGFSDIRNVLERASARETVARVAVGAVCKTFLDEFNINITSRVIMVAGKRTKESIKKKIDEAAKNKDTLGGIFQVQAKGVPVGLGSYVQYDRRLDTRLAAILMSIPGVKALEFGLGFDYANKSGSEVQDVIFYNKKRGFYRKTNNAGGIEGGISNGEPVIIKCCMKPISTLANPLDSVNINTKKPTKANIQRTDICVLWAAGVIAENVVAFELSNAILEKFAGDSIKETKRNFQGYLRNL